MYLFRESDIGDVVPPSTSRSPSLSLLSPRAKDGDAFPGHPPSHPGQVYDGVVHDGIEEFFATVDDSTMKFSKEAICCIAFLGICLLLWMPMELPSTSAQPEGGSETGGYFTYEGQEVYCKLYKPTKKSTGATVILLHGARFSSQDWEDIGTLQHLSDKGILAFAIDLPGFGKSKGVKAKDRVAFMKFVVNYVDGDTKVVVSPSMSGIFSIPYVNKHGTEISGYVPVAPARVEAVDPIKEVAEKLHVFAVVGSKDAGGVNGLKNFKDAFENYKELIIEDGSHPAYLDEPELFNRELSKFTLSLKK